MRSVVAVLALLALVSGCNTLRGVMGGGGGGDPRRAERTALWEQAHDAYSRDSVRVAAALFQRLANEHPRTHEGHEARFFVGVISLDPRAEVSLDRAEQNLGIYAAEDSLGNLRGLHQREAKSLLPLIRELRKTCDQRVAGLPCQVVVETRVAPGGTPSTADVGPELARLRRELTASENTIRELRAELQRIRNTLAPPRPKE